MQAELNAEAVADSTRKPIGILGINLQGLESGNSFITGGRILPWLQDVAAVDVWSTWRVNELRPDAPGVVWRDVIVVDAANHPIAVYNLTDHNLASPSNYEFLKATLRDAASH